MPVARATEGVCPSKAECGTPAKWLGIKCFDVEKDLGKNAKVAFFPLISYNKMVVLK